MKLKVLLLAVSMVLSCLSISYAEEKITLSTFYPAPYGEYDELIANKMTVGTTYAIPINDDDLLVEGNVGIGITGPGHLIHLNGGAWCDGTGDWITGSDRAYKKEINYDFQYGLKEIEQLRPVYYVHKEDKENKRQIGFIAQDTQEIIPEVVSGEEGALGLSYGQITAVLVKAMQEQQIQIEKLQKEMKELKVQAS